MTTRTWRVFWAVSVLAVVSARGGQAPAEIRVPEGSGVPVITDGLFSPGEWDDATRVALAATVQLYVKQYRGVVFVGIRGSGAAGIGPSELLLAAPGGPIHKLHVSAQLGEIVLPATGDAPAYRYGYTSEWYANEQRRDIGAAERLEKEGRNPIEIMTATSYPSDGIEFAIRRSKLPGPRWLTRLGVSYLEGGKPGFLVHPAETAERVTDGWLALRFD
jgi:hypothetical protein